MFWTGAKNLWVCCDVHISWCDWVLAVAVNSGVRKCCAMAPNICGRSVLSCSAVSPSFSKNLKVMPKGQPIIRIWQILDSPAPSKPINLLSSFPKTNHCCYVFCAPLGWLEFCTVNVRLIFQFSRTHHTFVWVLVEYRLDTRPSVRCISSYTHINI